MYPVWTEWLSGWAAWGRRRVAGGTFGLPARPRLDAERLEDRLAPAFLGGVSVAAGDVNADGIPDLVTGAGPGGGPHVRVIDGRTGQDLASFFAYDPSFQGGVTVAAGDVTGDGAADVVTGAGPGGGPHVRVFDGRTFAEVRGFYAFDPADRSGVSVAAGDVDGDGRAEVVVGSLGGSAAVRVFAGATGALLRSVDAFPAAAGGGVWVAAGDLDGDGRADVVAGAGSEVRAFSGVDGAGLVSFTAFEPGVGGVTVAAADLDADGRADVVTGAWAGGGARVRAFRPDGTPIPTPAGDFFAYEREFRGGVSVAAADLDADGRADLVTGAGPGGGPRVRAVRSPDAGELANFFAFDPGSAFAGFGTGVTINTAPTISDVPDVTVAVGRATGAIPFTVGDAQTPADRLALSVASSDPSLVPASAVTLGGEGADRTVTVAPPTGRAGAATITLTVRDPGGLTAVDSFQVTVVRDRVIPGAPSITDIPAVTTRAGVPTPALAFTVADPDTPLGELRVSVSTSDPGLIPLEGIATAGDGAARTVRVTPAPGRTGRATVTVTVADGDGLTASDEFEVTVLGAENTPPTVSGLANVTTPFGTPAGPLAFTVGDAESPAADLVVTAASSDPALLATSGLQLGGIGTDRTLLLTPAAGRSGTATITVTVTDPQGVSASGTFLLTVSDPASPPVLTPTADFRAATEFLYTGPDAVQTGVAPGAIDPTRAAVVRGRVVGLDGQPISGVAVTALGHSEFGRTATRADGSFDLAVNGGGLLTVSYQKGGFLPVQRQADVPWRDYAVLPEVALTPLDERVTTIDLSSPAAPLQVARGSVAADADGTRQATLLFPQGVAATMALPDGTTQPLTTLDVRATEYTVGDMGPMAMPGTLPPSSGYTYAVELSVDQAVAAGASTVSFSRAVPFYVENFLHFPVGTAVPSGYYDRQRGVWVLSDDGRVVEVVSVSDGMADLDTDGDDRPDAAAVLAALGIADAERVRLASLYQPGQSLWRVPVTHFTPWDCNWPYGPPPDARPPDFNPNEVTGHKPDDPNKECGSVIEVENQTLGEAIPIVGTQLSLVYQSDRVSGRTAEYTLSVPLTRETLPAGLKRVELTVSVAGRVFTQNFAPVANQKTTFVWDGRDAFGRTLQGTQQAELQIGYVYDGVYQSPAQLARTFAALSGIPLSANRARQEITLSQQIKSSVGTSDTSTLGLGGWSFDVLHLYDPSSRELHFGDGRDRGADKTLGNVITTVAGSGSIGRTGDGGPATQATLVFPTGVAVGPDGSLYIGEDGDNRDGEIVRRVGSDGVITTIAGTGEYLSSGDGGPATKAGLRSTRSLAVGTDGSLYIGDLYCVRRIGVDGIISTVAGTGIFGFSDDGGLATQSQLGTLLSIAVGPDNSLYIAEPGFHESGE